MTRSRYFLFVAIATIMFSGSFSGLPAAQAHHGNQITLEELGLLQLAAHDLFNVDRGDGINADTATDFENGRLDLSTLFINTVTAQPFSLTEIALGGEPRNRENIILFSVASEIGQNYVDDIMINGLSEDVARQNALNDYHSRFNSAYMSAFGESIPNPVDGCVTMQENFAFRTVHDFLPGEISLDLDENGVFDSFGAPTLDSSISDGFTPPFDVPAENPFGHTGPLTPFELSQLTSDLNGDLDMEFNSIQVIIPPIPPNPDPVMIFVDLEAADHSFGVQFMTTFSFQDFLDELVDGSYGPNEKVMKEIRNLIAKGYGGCYIGGEIIPIETTVLLVSGFQTSSWLIPVVLSILGIGVFVASRKPEN